MFNLNMHVNFKPTIDSMIKRQDDITSGIYYLNFKGVFQDTKDRDIHELIYLSQKDSKLYSEILHFDFNSKKIVKLRGNGKYVNGKLALIYYNKELGITGTYNLVKSTRNGTNVILDGYFNEYIMDHSLSSYSYQYIEKEIKVIKLDTSLLENLNFRLNILKFSNMKKIECFLYRKGLI